MGHYQSGNGACLHGSVPEKSLGPATMFQKQSETLQPPHAQPLFAVSLWRVVKSKEMQQGLLSVQPASSPVGVLLNSEGQSALSSSTVTVLQSLDIHRRFHLERILVISMHIGWDKY